LASDDAAEAHDRVVPAGAGEGLGDDGEVKGPGRPCDVHRVVRHPALAQRPQGALEQPPRHAFVEPADGDRNAEAGSIAPALEGFAHRRSYSRVSRWPSLWRFVARYW